LTTLPMGRLAAGGLSRATFTPVAALPSGVIVAVASYTTRHFDTNRDWTELTIIYRGIRWNPVQNRLVDQFYYFKPADAEGNPLSDVDGKPDAWELRTDDRFFPIVGTFQTRTLILNTAQRAAALLMDVRVVSRVDGAIQSEQGPSGDSWSLQDGDTVV